MKKTFTILVIIIAIFLATNINAQITYQKIYGTSTKMNCGFGNKLAIKGDLAVLPSNVSSSEGIVTIFRYNNNTWETEQVLTGSSHFGLGSSSMGSGSPVGIANGQIIIGEYEYSNGKVEIYGFDGSSWNLEQTILSDDNSFGKILSVDNDILVVSSDVNYHQYKYNGTEWVEENILPTLGYNLLVKDNIIALSYSGDSEYAPNNGAVVIYNYNNGVIDSIQKLNVSTLDTSAAFGNSLAIENDMMVIGAQCDYNYTHDVETAGRIFVFNLNAGLWELSTSIETEGIPDEDDYFGSSVSIYDGDIYAGESSYASNEGRVLKLEYDGSDWQSTDITPYEVGTGDYFARTSCFDSGNLLVGAFFDDDMGTNLGAAYIFDLCRSTGPDQNHEICEGESVLIDGTSYNTTTSVEERLTNAKGCDSIIVHNITVLSLPNVSANASQTEICEGEEITLYGGGATTYTWDNAVTNNVAFAPTSTTTYTVTGSDGNCENTAQIEVVYNALPIVIANASSTSICEGEEVTLYGSGATTYTWDNSVSDNVAFTPTSTVTYTVTGSDENCENTAQIEVVYNALPTVIANTSITTICEGEEITLYGSGATSYTWDNGVTDNTAFAPTSTTSYTVIGNDGNCENTDQITITVNSLPTVVANASVTTICEGEEVTLYGSGTASYTWDNGVTDNTAFTPTSTTTYTVTGTDGTCENTDQIEIIVNALPEQPTIILYGNELMSSATEGNQWYYTSVALSGETNQTFAPTINGDYYVEVTINGCSTMSEVYTYSSVGIDKIKSSKLSIYPNPSNGFINIEADHILKIEIIDITGRTVKYINTDTNKTTIDLSSQQQGTYFIKITTSNGVELSKLILK